MSLSNKLKKSGFWQSLEVVTLVIVQFSYFAVMARLLDKSDFGLMAIANSIIAFGNIFAESGMGAALIQRKNLNQKHINAALQGSLVIGFFLFIVVYISAPNIAEFFGLPEITSIMKVVAANFFLISLSSVSIGLLHKNFLFKESSIVTILSISTAYGMGVFLAIKGYGVWSLVYASILYAFLKLIGYLKFAPVKLSFKFHLKEWKELFSFGFGMVLLKINNYAASNGLNLVLGKIMSIDVLGVFERTYQLKTMPSSYLGNIIDRILFPAMAEVQDEAERLFKIFTHSLGLVNSILMPVAFYLIFFAEEIVLVMMGSEWSEAVLPLMIMFVVLPFSSSGRMADSVLR
ncbi:MAG: lipopolysaccharide biosynthesis protein, partial [Candidatus Paceibacterota bacterium]